MKSENFIVIQGWMCNELELKGNELLVFALIYGFSQDGQSRFYGNRNYIADTFNISLPTVDKAIEGLRSKNLITRYVITDENGSHYEYEVCKETLHGDVKKLYRGGKETLHNNTSKKTNKIKKNNSKELLQNSDFQFGKSKSGKESLYTKCVSLIDSYDFSIWGNIRKLLIEYLKFRLSVKDKPLYTNMWKGMLNKLVELCESDIQKYESIIKQSIEKGYLSFYPISSRGYSNLNEQPWEKGVKCDTYTDDEKREIEREREEMEARGERVWF